MKSPITIRQFYILGCILGTVLPMRHFIRFFMQHGMDMREFVSQVYATNIGAFFSADVVVSAVILTVFIFVEGRRLRMNRYWWPVFGLIVGVSLAFPLFLYVRQRHLESQASSRAR